MARVAFPPTREPLHPPPRPSYSHFVWQPRVRRQCDLKRNFRPEEQREREVKVGQLDRGMGRLKSQHLHGASVRDRNLAANPCASSHFHPCGSPNSGPRLLPQAGVLRRCDCLEHCLKIGPRGSSWAELTRSK